MRRSTTAIAAILMLGAPSPIDAAGRHDTGMAPSDDRAEPGAGLRVYYDPVTRTLLDHPATDEQRRLMQHALPAPDYTQFRTTILPDGVTLLDFGGQMEMTTVAHLHADGTVSLDCDAHAHDDATEVPP